MLFLGCCFTCFFHVLNIAALHVVICMSCCFIWIVFTELNFTVAFVNKENLGWLILPVRQGLRDFKKWRDLSNGGRG